MNILIIGPEVISRAITEALQSLGHRSHTVKTAEEAFGVLSDTGCDLILSSLQLPQMQVFEFVETVKRDSPIPIVVFGEHAQMGTMVAVMEVGANDFIVWPPQPDLLTGILQIVISRASLWIWIVSATSPLASQRLREIERFACLSTLEACDGDKTEAARRLGITPRTLSNKLKLWRQQVETAET